MMRRYAIDAKQMELIRFIPLDGMKWTMEE